MKKIFILVLLSFILISCSAAPSVKIGDTTVFVELALTYKVQMKGLMFREHLSEDQGMLFVFEKDEPRSFWMKNTLIPLDMIFIDSDFEIVDIKTAVPCEKDPCKSYVSKANAKYVLEVNSDFAEKHKIEIGDEVKLNI
ncbi:DUF192 domain-containing protein [Candidatus Woesearchaeota archaeon]|nr:DUF192 domain-containing protein [Candidatus Woesearchaeota archaeon]